MSETKVLWISGYERRMTTSSSLKVLFKRAIEEVFVSFYFRFSFYFFADTSSNGETASLKFASPSGEQVIPFAEMHAAVLRE